MFSRLKHQLPTLLPLGAGLLIIGLITVLGGLWNYQNELDNHLSAAPVQPVLELASHKKAAGSTVKSANANGSQSTGAGKSAGSMAGAAQVYQVPGTKASRIVYSSSPSSSGSAGSTASGTSGSAASVISVSLNVNGQAKGSVRVASGSTQCDVLSQALAQGVIQSLDMRYSSQWGTQGVYVINGMGDPGVVWWTYTVNGTAPPYGCGYTTVHAGDSVNWRYIKG